MENAPWGTILTIRYLVYHYTTAVVLLPPGALQFNPENKKRNAARDDDGRILLILQHYRPFFGCVDLSEGCLSYVMYVCIYVCRFTPCRGGCCPASTNNAHKQNCRKSQVSSILLRVFLLLTIATATMNTVGGHPVLGNVTLVSRFNNNSCLIFSPTLIQLYCIGCRGGLTVELQYAS